MLKYLLPLLLLFTQATAEGQGRSFSLSIFNNGTSLPGEGYAGTFSKTIHPGVTFGTYHYYQTKTRHDLFQSFKLGYFYHRHAQHAIQLYSELGYRYKTNCGIYLEGLIGGGYLHSFADVQQFKWDGNKYVTKTNWGRPQLMATGSVVLGYDFQARHNMPFRLFLQYQCWMQTPFVNKYVPLLPNTALHLGFIYTLPQKVECCHKI